MMMKAATILIAMGMVSQVHAQERDFLARFDGGIGVAANAVVRGVNPPPGPWRIGSLRADIDTNGRVRIRGRGLLIAAGDFIGTNFNQKVFATLICVAAAPVQHSTNKAGVALEPNGDFRIDDTLDTVPAECPSPVLLIRSTGGVWFAAGIPKFTDDEN